MEKTKKLLFARNVLIQLSKEEIQQIEDELYSDEEKVMCVDAVHFNETGYISDKYTWYIAQEEAMFIEIDDILVVEQLVGIGYAIVKAVSTVYQKTKKEHENDFHPYCKVISILPPKVDF